MNYHCAYYEPDNFLKQAEKSDGISFMNLNCRGLVSNWENFLELVCNISSDTFSFDVIGLTEVYKYQCENYLSLPGYHNIIARVRDDNSRGGVGFFIKENIKFRKREDLSLFIPHVIETLFIEFETSSKNKSIAGIVYRPNSAPLADIDVFSTTILDIVHKVNSEKKKCYIMGDMNLDLLKYSLHLKTNDYLENFFVNGFLPMITKPTRITQSSATLIDHIFTNNLAEATSGIIITDVSDHFAVFYIAHSAKSRQAAENVQMRRHFSEQNYAKFRQDLETADFSEVNEADCPNKAYHIFINKIKTSVDLAFPVSECRKSANCVKYQPWITSGLKVSLKKMRLYRISKQCPTDQNINKYKTYNNMLNKVKRKLKCNYFSKKIEQYKNNAKFLWGLFNQALGKKQTKKMLPEKLKI